MCLRVTDMRGVDLERFPFDFDLTFAALTMHPDGRVYHRYGGRDERDPDHWLTLASFKRVLEQSEQDHRAYAQSLTGLVRKPAMGPKTSKPLHIEGVPSYKKRDKGACIHCHSVLPALYEEQIKLGSWTDMQRWRYSSPTRIGLDLDRDDQQLIVRIAAASPAAKAGLRVGDRLQSFGSAMVVTASDVMFQLDRFPADGGRLDVELKRGQQKVETALELEADWKRGTPLEFSWRPFKWGLTPAPGFGGPQLDRDALLRLDLITAGHSASLPFAMRVNYLVTWGENRRYGQAVMQAGLRKGDIVLALAGKSDFASVNHFHSWWRLTREAGQTVAIEVLRGEKRLTFEVDVLP
ncbi:MAG: hypothetical protein ACI841_003328 [Planctomycetota bacterium]